MADEFDPQVALEALARHGVRFVVIGGIAANIHGSPVITGDLDVCYARERANLERLSDALHELHAKLRGPPADVPFLLDAKTLEAGDAFTFVTDAGPLDILGTPAGTEGFDALDRTALEAEIHGTAIRVAALEDLIRMKRAAGRPKDRFALEHLGALRDRLEAKDD